MKIAKTNLIANNLYKGFTLIELSIVIVVIGLIVAGVVGGQSLIQHSKLRTVATELNQFKIQINAFSLEYNAIPGDMSNAHDYWGPSCDTSASRCNGDGDGRVEFTAPANNREITRYWQHLSLAELVNRQFDGIGGPHDCEETTCYFSKSGKARYFSETHQTAYSYRATPISMRSIVMFSAGPPGQNFWWAPAYTVPEAFKLDSKIDDGVANQGQLIAFQDTGLGVTGCASDSAGGSDYVAANLGDKSTKRCRIGYIIK